MAASRLTEGQKRLLMDLSTRGMPRLDQACMTSRCTTTDAFDLEDKGFVRIQDDESDKADSDAVVFITEAGKRAVGR